MRGPGQANGARTAPRLRAVVPVRSSSWLSSAAVPLGRTLPIFAVWIGLAVFLSQLTVRVRDWFVMTNELLYERRAISVVRDSSPLPRLHGELIPSFDQLYPLLVAPAFRHGTVAHDLGDAHVLNAWIMSSACIPAFLLARRVTPLWAAYVAAVAAVCIPWILYASFLLTEVAAYPAFLWALLAMQRGGVYALVAPRPRGAGRDRARVPRPHATRAAGS